MYQNARDLDMCPLGRASMASPSRLLDPRALVRQIEICQWVRAELLMVNFLLISSMLLLRNPNIHSTPNIQTNNRHSGNSYTTDKALPIHMALIRMFRITTVFTPSVIHQATTMLHRQSINTPNLIPTSSTAPRLTESTHNRPNRNSTSTAKKYTPKVAIHNTRRSAPEENRLLQMQVSHPGCTVSRLAEQQQA
jgi:hypothetical protein